MKRSTLVLTTLVLFGCKFTESGKVGVWTKADSIIQFDDLSATAL